MTVVLRDQKISLDVLFDTVTIDITCGDDYAAQVLFDDLVQRLRAGESITLSVLQKVAQKS